MVVIGTQPVEMMKELRELRELKELWEQEDPIATDSFVLFFLTRLEMGGQLMEPGAQMVPLELTELTKPGEHMEPGELMVPMELMEPGEHMELMATMELMVRVATYVADHESLLTQ
jgi:hypothetical protein